MESCAFDLCVPVARRDALLFRAKWHVVSGPVGYTDADRSRVTDGIFLAVVRLCVGNEGGRTICHNELATGDRDRRPENGGGDADQVCGCAWHLPCSPKLLFHAETDRISDKRWRYRPRLLLSSLQSRLAGAVFGKTSITCEEPRRSDHCDRLGPQSFCAVLDQSWLRCT